MSLRVEKILSLPAGSAARFAEIDPFRARDHFVASDPPGSQLGSGGGTAFILSNAWRARRAKKGDLSFDAWVAGARKLLVHGSGESRRLPPYAAAGKPLTPVPILRGVTGQRPDQLLLDLQEQSYEQLYRHAPDSFRLMVACGDVLLSHSDSLPAYPEVDVLIVGLSASVEEAGQHGVMVCPSVGPATLHQFLQKPSPDEFPRPGSGFMFYLDTGVWLLSRRALDVLMRKCGWNPARQTFRGGMASNYDLYAAFGPALGAKPAVRDRDIAPLTCAVLPLPDGRFYHFGTNRSLLASVHQLQRPAHDLRSFGHASMESPGTPVIQHSDVQAAFDKGAAHIWIENSTLPATWRLSGRHVLTGVPANEWTVRLPQGACLDFVPVSGGALCVRAFGFDDLFKGKLSDCTTAWMGHPASAWLKQRGLTWDDAGLDPRTDIQAAALFPVLRPDQIASDLLTWLFDPESCADADAARRCWLRARRCSARDLLREADIVRLTRQRHAHMRRAFESCPPEAWAGAVGRLDLQAAAALCARERWRIPSVPVRSVAGDLSFVHDRMFCSAVARSRRQPAAKRLESEAFAGLRDVIVREMDVPPVTPGRNVIEDQIVWGRSPVRLDLAGGWTDTPPYCLERGGRVVNVAVDLNGQPPIQVFARFAQAPEIVVRSIDLGVHERLGTYAELEQWAALGSGFGIARAALALAGFSPAFHTQGGGRTLRSQLERELGGGIELSLLAAVPKGSGLGTSSILAATLLGTLSELLGLHWTINDLLIRTLALEQMLTSGGGWQDQAGGITPSLKIIETEPGLAQKPVFRWLPDRFFSPEYANTLVMLYYTGITRVAHGILSEIVRGLFLNSAAHVRLIDDIGRNAGFAADALQRNDWEGACEAIRRSWRLNQLLDAGTNPPAVQSIVRRIAPYVAGCKLLGAGGGGYMLILAKDIDAGKQIRHLLARNPPNPRARFVDLSLSKTGFQVTRS